MLLREVVETSAAVAATRSRIAKVAALAACLSRASDDLEIVLTYLSGSLRQRRTGVGWRSLETCPAPAPEAQLTVSDVDRAFEDMSQLTGSGSRTRRAEALVQLFARATAAEQAWLRAVAVGNVRQGALASLVVDAVAQAADVPLASVRRAAMLSGEVAAAGVAAFSGGERALAAIGLEVGRPVAPMLAASAPDVADAMSGMPGEVAVDAKLDGIRIQVHRDGERVVVVTRSLDDITARLPEVVDLALRLPVRACVLDGEVLRLSEDGLPRPFQETAARTASHTGGAVTPFFFDLLHLDGRDLLDEPAHVRLQALEALVPAQHQVPRTITTDPHEAARFYESVLERGHEGVVVKDLSAPYEAGRRGAAWVKVKPVRTADLVVVGVEHGSGRRRGWLSNIHLAARDAASGDLTMVGKTFKGMSDAMLAWQTERFGSLAIADDGWVVSVRPEQVVEVAFDGVQASSRYPGGVALRFARVVAYRDDKPPEDADTIQWLRSLLPGAPH